MLGLPGDQLYRHGRFKEIARRALGKTLPEAILRRREPTTLSPLFEAAIRGEGREASRRLLRSRDALWPRFVRREWVDSALERSVGTRGDVALWNCLALELWRRRHQRG